MEQRSSKRVFIVLAVLLFAIATFFILRRHQENGSSTRAISTSDFSHADKATVSNDAHEILDHISYRKTSDFDPGSIVVYIRNTTGENLSFSQVLLDKLPIPVWGIDWKADPSDGSSEDTSSHTPVDDNSGHIDMASRQLSAKRVVWARFDPPIIPPGVIGEFRAKLSNAMTRPMKIEFVSGDKTIVSTVARPIPPSLTITAITFSEKLDAIYVYFEGYSDAPQTITGIEVDGHRVPNAWLSSANLLKGEKQLAIVSPSKPLARGNAMTVKVLAADGLAAEERVRDFSGFPINFEHNGPTPDEFGLDPEQYTRDPSYFETAESEQGAIQVPPADALTANYIFDCAMHRYAGDKTRCAQEIFKRYDICRLVDPAHPSLVHLCRVRPETGYALFGETADILRINPDIDNGLSEHPKNETPSQTVARITRYAIDGARPKPVQALADTAKFGQEKGLADPAEFRRRTYAMLGQGIKGILFRHSGWKATDSASVAINSEIKRSMNELRWIRKDLAIAENVPWVKIEGSMDVDAYTLLVGKSRLLVFLVRHESGAATVIDPVVKLQLPSWAKARSISIVTPEGLTPGPELHRDGTDCQFSASKIGNATIYAVKFDSGN